MKILVVDDDATNRLVLKGLLEKDGHSVVLAEDGRQAVQSFLEQAPDMILMDIMMPVMDGYEATREIKKLCDDRFVPIIFLTAMSGEDALVSCIKNGGDDFLKKPYNRTILSAKIEAMERIQKLYATVASQRVELLRFQQHVNHEHEVAEKIFANIMAQGDLETKTLRTVRKSADAFNGDMVIAAKNASGGMNVLVGDFTGHGLAAAIGALPVADVFYRMSAKGFSISDMVQEINRKLSALLPKGRFLAAMFLHIDSQFSTLKVWNGGMPEGFIVSAQGKIRRRLESSKLPLGVVNLFELDSDVDVYEIKQGDRIFVYSDGVVEMVNSRGEMYGFEALEQVVEKHGQEESFIDHVNRSLHDFREATPLADDVTLMEWVCDAGKGLRETAQTESINSKQAVPWRFSFHLYADTLKQSDPMTAIFSLIREMGIQPSEDVFVVFTELFNNALDHGVLKLNSQLKNEEGEASFMQYYIEREARLQQLSNSHIRFDVEHQPTENGGRFQITCEDSGAGFDHQGWLQREGDDLAKSGRGLRIIASIADKMRFNEHGNSIDVTLSWKY